MRHIIAHARSALDTADHAAAAQRFHEAAEKARVLELAGELAYALRHAALASLEIGDTQRALIAAEEAASIYDRLESTRGVNYANAARLVALAMERLGMGEKSAALWAEARHIYHLHGIVAGVEECDAHLSSFGRASEGTDR
ncbi:MAG: hypothetical protein ACX930_01385 [Erythrobacter sp.]